MEDIINYSQYDKDREPVVGMKAIALHEQTSLDPPQGQKS